MSVCRFLIGNDFIPSLLTLDVRLGGLELLLEIQVETFQRTGFVLVLGQRLQKSMCLVLIRHFYDTCVYTCRWLTDAGQINFKSFAIFLERLASVETALLQQNKKLRAQVCIESCVLLLVTTSYSVRVNLIKSSLFQARRNATYWGRKRRSGSKKGPSQTSSLPSSARQCKKFSSGRNCRRGNKCSFLHGDYVPAIRTEQQKSMVSCLSCCPPVYVLVVMVSHSCINGPPCCSAWRKCFEAIWKMTHLVVWLSWMSETPSTVRINAR